MSGSQQEVQELAAQLLELLGVRLQSGQVVLNFNDGRFASYTLQSHHRLVTTDAPDDAYPTRRRPPRT